MKTLNLYNSTIGYNNAAGILADKNHFPGIDMVKFGENISVIHKRATFDHISIFEVLRKKLQRCSRIIMNMKKYKALTGKDRKIPEAAFREAIANALIHRAWDMDSQIKVSMFDDRIEIILRGTAFWNSRR